MALAIPWVIAYLTGAYRNAIFIFLGVWAGILVGALGCELILAAIFLATLRRTGSPPPKNVSKDFGFWRGMVGFFRSFLFMETRVLQHEYFTVFQSIDHRFCFRADRRRRKFRDHLRPHQPCP